MRLLCATLLLLTTSLSAMAAGVGDAQQWLQRLADADVRLAYRGLLIYESGDNTESLQVTHGRVDGQPYDHLEYLDGDRREVIRSGSSLTCIHPGQRLQRLLQSSERGEVGALEHHYRLQLTGESRVAGRPVVTLEAVPRDSFRFGYRFALDRETGLPLRYEQVDARLRVLERFQFANIQISEQMPPQWRRDEEAAVTQVAAAAAVGVPQLPARWLPRWLPPGFAPLAATVEEGGDMQSYSDGLASFSIFVEESERVVDGAGSARRGATIAYTAPLSFGEKTYVVTVVGEVPPITAQRVADAVGWQEPSS